VLERMSTVTWSAVTPVDPVSDLKWLELARAHGSLFTSPPWLGALRDTYDVEIEAWLTRDRHGAATGGVPFARLGDGRWRRLCSLPFSDYCNPIDVDGSSWPDVSQWLLSEGLPVEIRHLGESDATVDRLFEGASPPDLWHGVNLDVDEDRAWSALPGSARRAIRKARGAGVQVRVTRDASSLRAFYELHLGTRKHKYRLLAQPFSFFVALQERFGDGLALIGAWHGGDLIAGILLLTWADTLYYKFNASSPAALEVRPNDLLMWEATRFGVASGLNTLDLGRTDSDHESLARYKSKYATVEKPIRTIRAGTFGRDPAIAAVLGTLTELLTRPDVPDHITEEAGNLVYRHFA